MNCPVRGATTDVGIMSGIRDIDIQRVKTPSIFFYFFYFKFIVVLSYKDITVNKSHLKTV